MAQTPGPSRKRQRHSADSIIGWDTNTIKVQPRKRIAIKHPRELSLTETPIRGDTSNRRRVPTRIQNLAAAQSLNSTPILSRSTAEVTRETVPSDCCYHCLTRGGNAAYECFKEEREDRCTRCVRDKKGLCRIPTVEEATSIAARCPQCTRRGFKRCDGGNPCDTCVRNKTPDKCRQPAKKNTNRESLLSRSAYDNSPARNEEATAREASIGGSRTQSSEPGSYFTPMQDEQTEQPSFFEDESMAIDEDHRADANDSTGPVQTILSKSAMELPESDVQDILINKYRFSLPRDRVVIPEATDQEEAFDTGSQGFVENQDGSGDDEVDDTAMVCCDTLPSPPTSNPSPAEKTDEVDLLSSYEDETDLAAPSNARPRRSRGRVSYLKLFEDDPLDGHPRFEDTDGSDAYASSTTINESDSDEDPDLAESEVDTPAESVADADAVQDIMSEEEDESTRTSKKPSKQRNTANSAQKKAGKGIDRDLPPLNNIVDIFADMSARAAQLGLSNALENLKGYPINVATMCSGTESPLLALDLLSKARNQAGLSPLSIKHHFSAEIEVIKQGYIERNFQPDILFRDVRDFLRKDATTATTAYGAEVPIPTGLDILVAGFVCKDLSRMNNNGKDLDGDGESGDTWRAVRTYAEQFRPSIVLLENVMAKKSTWQNLVSWWDKIGYEAAWLYCDTKNYYLPQTRVRMYMIAIERSHFGKGAAKAVEQWKDLMQNLRRQCSSPYEAFLSGSMHEANEYNTLVSEPDWGLCKLRYDHIRSDSRLGILRPLIRSSESGTIGPPDFANRKFLKSQSSRVYDALEVAHLECAQMNFDSTSKMMTWDVSQNADRFDAGRGITKCITPEGSLFSSNSHQVLNGKQLLTLQGIPLDKLLFARETQKDCQDLAGNAMSTTVIGSSLVSAIISGWKSFTPKTPSAPRLTTADTDRAVSATKLSTLAMKQEVLHPNEFRQLDIHGLKECAELSARMCYCEGNKSLCKSAVKKCSACGHTACEDCAGNPQHAYSIAFPKGSRPHNPIDFVNEWRPRLPARLKFETFPEMQQSTSGAKIGNQTMRAFADRMAEVQLGSQYFCLSDLVRQDSAWKATYNAPQARLELSIGAEIQWLLFITCERSVPGNSPLRKLLEGPVARARVVESLLNAQWELFQPSNQHCIVQISGSTVRSRSWKRRIGLPDFQEETVPATISVHSNATQVQGLTGEYGLLPHCGTACNSLYKRATNPPLYMFLDPDPIDDPGNDSFVFSYDCSRKQFGDARISLAILEPSWRPWDLESSAPKDVSTTFLGIWKPATLELKSACPPVKASVLQRLEHSQEDCSQSIKVLGVRLPDNLPSQELSDHYWALKQATPLLCELSKWQKINTKSSEQCHCAPPSPRILWHVNERCIATPHEDRKAAAKYERAIKTRQAIISIQPASHPHEKEILMGINVLALVHRAQGRLAQLGFGSTVSTHTQLVSTSNAWRLVTDHADLPPERFPRFRLQSNAEDALHALSYGPAYLRGAQPKSLSWMATQELGRTITIIETEEAIQADLGLRAEARAQASVSVRGGVLADLPSFGKTVTTIALIQSELKQHTPNAIIRCNEGLAGTQPHLISSAATLIVCPPHIALQWQHELEKFLGSEEYSHYNVLTVKSFAQLQCLTTEEVTASRVVIVSWSVFAEEEYISYLAHFTGMPEPTTTNRRAFDAWFSRTADEISSQLDLFENVGFEGFQAATRDLLEKRLQHGDFQAALPIKTQHGSAYQSFNSNEKGSRKANGSKAKSKPPLKRKVSSPEAASHLVPLLHLFRFNRIVVDEYHYLNDDKKTSNMLASVSVKRIAAHKRWVLSGTPALANFTDVDQIASYLGIKLGRSFCGDGTVTTSLEKSRRSTQTQVEDFLSQTDVMSRQWHQARHERAQEFLDLFVRQNEAELHHIACSEVLLPVELTMAHYAVYLEASQHLSSQNMQIKKLNNKLQSDRTDRLNASLNNAATAEEALQKLVFEKLEGQAGLEALKTKRSEQCRHTEKDLLQLMAGLEGLKKDEELSKLYGRFKKDIKTSNWLGDQESMQRVRGLLAKAEKMPTPKGFPELKSMSAVKGQRHTKKLLSQLRETTRELAMRKRSERFISNIMDLLRQPLPSAESQLYTCSSPQCKGTTDLAHLCLISHCGHKACGQCLEGIDDGVCVDPLCTVPMQTMDLIKLDAFGSTRKHSIGQNFGTKLEAVTQVIKKLPKDDQCLVFAPNEDIVGLLEEVFKHYKISYHSPSYYKPAASAAIMEDFKTNQDPDERKKVLILNLGSESAAGVNLINANHVIFVAPLLAKSQYEYDSAMVQAIARSRRYGQKKTVHIYHAVALGTIDVDIIEHRHKRSDGITTSKSSLKMPNAVSMKKEKSRLIKNNADEMALVPSSWLDDEPKRELLDVKEQPASFTSLIKFSEMFELHDDD